MHYALKSTASIFVISYSPKDVMGQSLGELVAAGFSLRRKTQAKACDYHKFPPFTDRLPSGRDFWQILLDPEEPLCLTYCADEGSI